MSRIAVNESLMGPHGVQIRRGSLEDFVSLWERVGYSAGRQAHELLRPATDRQTRQVVKSLQSTIDAYDGGDYSRALIGFERLQSGCSVRTCFSPYVTVCKRVLSMPIHRHDLATHRRFIILNKLALFGKIVGSLTVPLRRCKWCGRYTQKVSPDVPLKGLGQVANKCRCCGREYPMPSFIWDSDDGRAYSYFRRSFSDRDWYSEFASEFDIQGDPSG